MKINKDKSWLLFYVAAALMLGVLMMACSSDEDQDPVEYIKSVDGYWVKSKTVTVQGMCDNTPVQPTTFTYKTYYKFNLQSYFNDMKWWTGNFCAPPPDNSFMTEQTKRIPNPVTSKLGEGGYIGSVDGNVIFWDVDTCNYKITLSSDRKSLNVVICEPGGNDRDEGNYVLVSTEEANSTLNSLANYPN